MTDDLNQKRPEDAAKVNLRQQWELAYWADHFDCTQAELKKAIQEVGPLVKDLEKHFQN